MCCGTWIPSSLTYQDLEKLLLEFEHLFPDVPTRTDQIYHDVMLAMLIQLGSTLTG